MIVIVDYRAGNLTSVQHALAEIGQASVISSRAEDIALADRLIFPGVGAAGASMAALRELGLIEPLKRFVAEGNPFLGICVGCQILLETSLEDGSTACLGLLPGTTGEFKPGPTLGSEAALKVPHMGWNPVHFKRSHPLFEGIADNSHFYFVHSYYPLPSKASDIAAETTYGAVTFASILARDNVAACQFHAEKSGLAGLKLLRNFCAWDGKI
jgi:imidazole glycerol-phosphate synthase subunit HisH